MSARAPKSHASHPVRNLLLHLERRIEQGDVPLADGEKDDIARLALATAALTGDATLQHAAARDTRTPPHLLAHLAEGASEDVRIALAGNPSTPAMILARFAEDDRLLGALAGNAALPTYLLLRLAKHWNAEVRRRVAFNPSAPEPVRRGMVTPVLPPETYVG
mgnify:CR=1 FL=1